VNLEGVYGLWGPTCRRRIHRTGPTVQRQTVQRQNGRWQNMLEAERQTTIATLISSRDILIIEK
jgi:hypothetical protein